MPTFKHEEGDWTSYRQLPNLTEFDFHFGSGRGSDESYWERMVNVSAMALQALIDAQASGEDWVLFRRGWSTSRIAATTSRSVVRNLMRSPEATSYIIRSECIPRESVFVARVRPKRRAA
jgi:hypothetical protein